LRHRAQGAMTVGRVISESRHFRNLEVAAIFPGMKDLSDRMDSKQGTIFEFDGYLFDRERCLLSRDGKLIPASRKVMETLACLLEGAPEPVSKSHLMGQVWPSLVIEETGLHRNISMLRKLLSSQTGKQYLETIPKVGYRFVGEVRLTTNRDRADVFAAGVFTNANAADAALETASTEAIVRPNRSRIRAGVTFILMSLVLGTVVACYSLQPASKQSSFRMTAVTTRSQERPIVAAAINSAGTRIAYAERDALFVKNIDETDASEVKLPPRVIPTYVRWMPGDDELILSATDTQTDECTIWVLSLKGAEPHQLIRNGTLANTSPAGKHVAFVRDREEIWIADAGDGREKRLARAPGNYRFVYPPQFTADGRFIVDGLHKPSDPETTIETRRLTDGKVIASVKLPRLQAFTLLGSDALLLSIFSSRGLPPVEIAIQPFDPERGASGPKRKVVQLPDATAYKLTASADARNVVLIRDRTQSDVYLADIAAQTHAMQNVRRLTFDDASDFPWGWTADSKSVLFHSLRANTFHVFEQLYDKTTAHDVIGDARDSKWPLMTGDGRWLFYFSARYPYQDGPQSLTLMRQRVGTSEPGQPVVSFSHEDVGLRCAVRTARCVVIDQTADSSSISDLQADTGSLKHLFDVPLVSRHYQQWSLSPDGGRLAVLNEEGIHIFSLSRRALEREIAVKGGCALRALVWDPEGTGFYVSKTAGDLGVITHVQEGGEETVLYSGPMSAGGWVVPSPDGNHVAFQQWVPSANVWMIELPSSATRAEQAMQRLANLRL
jgi:DNA-binding winged helix-turn-helix (wHTH) protein/Tol biopolymer transport system component